MKWNNISFFSIPFPVYSSPQGEDLHLVSVIMQQILGQFCCMEAVSLFAVTLYWVKISRDVQSSTRCQGWPFTTNLISPQSNFNFLCVGLLSENQTSAEGWKPKDWRYQCKIPPSKSLGKQMYCISQQAFKGQDRSTFLTKCIRSCHVFLLIHYGWSSYINWKWQ